MNLTLAYPLTFTPSNKSYIQAVNSIYKEPIGSDKILEYSYRIEDENIILEHIRTGEKAPLTQEEKTVIEQGLPPLKRDGEIPFLHCGQYLFSQMAPIDDDKDLPLLIFGECEKNFGKVYIRLFKENTIEVIMQFFFPKEE